MKGWRKILLPLLAFAVAVWPVASLSAYAVEAESNYDTCITSWDGMLSNLSSLATNVGASEEVFCGHFMSVEDIPLENTAADFVPAPPVFTLQNLRFFVPDLNSHIVFINAEHAPHSLNPEVAPHPPKHC